MRKLNQGGGFGIVVLLVVVVVVMLLSARMLRRVGGAAVEVTRPDRKSASTADLPPPSVNTGAGQRQIQASTTDAQRKTDAHTREIRDALKGAE